ncbi:putative late blight resistance proteinR1B-23 [Abeliophyllum distichum]|uniref:Late blight resistance proteinR1B-23 n=1 Tax=Abeliophyllum distichum TaxID=126358 RepID=A0ABD1PQ90_9LAMI
MHLRPWFLYFGAFEEDKEIPVRKLISLWVSEGFVKKEEHKTLEEEQKTLEDAALGYLMKLIDRNLVLVAKRRFDGRFKTCILPSMETFHRLECLVVNTLDEVEIPDILLNMPSLRHMHFLGGGYFSASSLQRANNDESFQIHNLQSIFVLEISGETDGKILRCSPNLHRLKVNIQSSPNYSFDFLKKLESLMFKSKKLCSTLISLPLNLKQLTLAHTCMSPEQMEIIRKLECLEVLKL